MKHYFSEFANTLPKEQIQLPKSLAIDSIKRLRFCTYIVAQLFEQPRADINAYNLFKF